MQDTQLIHLLANMTLLTQSKEDHTGADHLRRDAFLYIRQSSVRQVSENTESINANIHCTTARRRWSGRLSVYISSTRI